MSNRGWLIGVAIVAFIWWHHERVNRATLTTSIGQNPIMGGPGQGIASFFGSLVGTSSENAECGCNH